MNVAALTEIKARVHSGRVWVVCPHCERGADIAVKDSYVRGRITCKCRNPFRVIIVRRICERKSARILGKLWMDDATIHPVIITDISLYGVGFTSSYTHSVGKEYSIVFSLRDREVRTTIKIVRQRKEGSFGAECVFPAEYCEAKAAFKRIFEQIA